MSKEIRTITVGELRRDLEGYSDDTEIIFSGLEFFRLKKRGDKLVQVEFNELVYRENDTGKVVVENFDEE